MVNYSVIAGNENITTFEEMLEVANEITDGLFPITIIISLWIIIFLGLSAYRKIEAFTAASFITFIIASVFWGMNMLNPTAIAILVVMTVAGAYFQNKN